MIKYYNKGEAKNVSVLLENICGSIEREVIALGEDDGGRSSEILDKITEYLAEIHQLNCMVFDFVKLQVLIPEDCEEDGYFGTNYFLYDFSEAQITKRINVPEADY